MKIFVSLLSAVLICSGCSTTARDTRDSVGLAELPADAKQAAAPQWVKVTAPYPLFLFQKVEIDLNSIRPVDEGVITV